MKGTTLEDLVQRLGGSEIELPIIKQYWEHSPPLAELVVRQYQALLDAETYPVGDKIIFTATEPGRLRSWNIIEFYGRNYPVLRELEHDLARRIVVMIGVTATPPILGWKKAEVQELVDRLITFNETTKQYLCPESRESLFKFLHHLAHRQATAGEKINVVTSVFDTYTQWMGLQQTDQLGLGASLLEKIARHYSLPIPNLRSRILEDNVEDTGEEPIFFSLPLDPYEALGLIEKAGLLYREYFSGVTALNLPVTELSELLLSALQPEAEDKYNQRRLLLNHRQEQQLRRLCHIIREQRCQTIKEVVNCASLEVPDYNVVSVMRGGLGNVFLVQHQRQKEITYAVKIFGHRESMADSPARAQEFLSAFGKTMPTQREADLNAQLREGHEHIVRYIEEITVRYHGEELPAIKMEYVPGVNLKEQIETGGSLPPFQTLRYLEQIVKGLDFLHAHGLKCMGDLKPDNILIADRGKENKEDKKDKKIMLTDFGLAWTKEKDALIAGSRYYTAPEAFVDPEAVSPVSDWWGVGMLAYYALTGKTLLREKESPNVPQQLQEMYNQRELPEEYRQKIGEKITNAFFQKFILAALQPAVEQREKEVTGYIESVRNFGQWPANVTETTKKKITALRKRSLDHLVREQEGSLVNVPLLSFREGKRGEDEPYPITVEEILKSQEPVLIFGHGGQGKTMLATAIAQKLLSSSQGEEDQKEEELTIPLLIEAGELNSVLGRHEPKTADKIIDLIWDSVAEKRIDPHLRSLLGVAYLIDDYHKINPDYRKLLEEMVLTTKSKVLLFSRLERADLQPPKNPGYVTVQIDSRSFSTSLDQFIQSRVPEEKQAEFKQYLAQYDESISGNFITLYVLTMVFSQPEKIIKWSGPDRALVKAVQNRGRLTAGQLYDIETDFVLGNEFSRTHPGWSWEKIGEEIRNHKDYLAELAWNATVG